MSRGAQEESAFVRCAFRPFDNRWLYLELDSGLVARPSPDYKPHVFDSNLWLGASKREIDE